MGRRPKNRGSQSLSLLHAPGIQVKLTGYSTSLPPFLTIEGPPSINNTPLSQYPPPVSYAALCFCNCKMEAETTILASPGYYKNSDPVCFLETTSPTSASPFSALGLLSTYHAVFFRGLLSAPQKHKPHPASRPLHLLFPLTGRLSSLPFTWPGLPWPHSSS